MHDEFIRWHCNEVVGLCLLGAYESAVGRWHRAEAVEVHSCNAMGALLDAHLQELTCAYSSALISAQLHLQGLCNCATALYSKTTLKIMFPSFSGAKMQARTLQYIKIKDNFTHQAGKARLHAQVCIHSRVVLSLMHLAALTCLPLRSPTNTGKWGRHMQLSYCCSRL